MEVTVRLPIDMLFVPRWLDNINPYAASSLTARIITPLPYNRVDGRVRLVVGQTTVTGTIVPKEEQLAVQASIVSNREERKAKRRQDMNAQSAGNWMNYMEVRAERRAAKEAKRIMEERRQQIIAAFTKEDV
jgi:regulator of protease activity HflC (stomatin/prohibitin superfamily)